MIRSLSKKLLTGLIILSNCLYIQAQPKATITIHADKPGNLISPALHGVFFEEISHAGEGGLYAELIQNRDSTGFTKPSKKNILTSKSLPAWALAISSSK